MAGIRLGYAFAPPEIAAYLQHLRRPFMISTLTTVAGIAAIGDVGHIVKTLALVVREKVWLYGELERLGVMVRSAVVMRAKGCVRVTVGMRTANEVFVRELELAIMGNR